MADLLTELGKVAGVLAFLGYIPYLLSIVKRKTLPNPATWGIWSIMGAILLAIYYADGTQEAIWVPVSYFVGPTVTALLSLKYGRNEFGKFEWYCLAGVAASLVLWKLSNSSSVPMTIIILIDLIAIAPTLRKTYFKPDSEDPLAWSVFWLANTINLYVVLASETVTYAAIAYPLELFFLPTSIMALVIRGRFVKKTSRRSRRPRRAAVSHSAGSLEQTYSALENQVIAHKTPATSAGFNQELSDLVRQGARRIIAQAVAAELDEFLGQQKGLQGDRTNLQGTSPVSEVAVPEVAVPNVSSGFEQRSAQVAVKKKIGNIKVSPQQLPPYLKNSLSPEALLPWLCLKGISAEDLNQALSELLGAETTPLPPTVFSQLNAQWQTEHSEWQNHALTCKRYVYLWADRIYLPTQDGTSQCILVVMGVSADGYKELLGLAAGRQELASSWQSLLLKLKEKGLQHDPQLAIGEDESGFWQALSQVFPTTRRQPCWEHKVTQILGQLPKKLQRSAKKDLWEIYRAETRKDACEVFEQFVTAYQVKYPEAAECLRQNQNELLTFYDFPAEHWPYLRSTEPIESTFATVRLSTAGFPGEFSKSTNLLSFVFKLVQSAQTQWHRLPGFKYLGNVIEGAVFVDGMQPGETANTANTLTDDQQAA